MRTRRLSCAHARLRERSLRASMLVSVNVLRARARRWARPRGFSVEFATSPSKRIRRLRLPALQTSGQRRIVRHAASQPLPALLVELALGRVARRPDVRVPSEHGADRRLGAPRRRMGDCPPLPELRHAPHQPRRRRRQPVGHDVTGRAPAGAAAISVGDVRMTSRDQIRWWTRNSNRPSPFGGR